MSEPIHQLPIERMRAVMQKIMREDKQKSWIAMICWRCNGRNHVQLTFNGKMLCEQCQATETRQRWLYAFVTVTVLALLGWLVSGGCK